MTYHYVDYAAEADSHRKTAAKCYYRSRRYAKHSAEQYRFAAEMRKHANWLTRHPDLWGEMNPVVYERIAVTAISGADTELGISFSEFDRAHFYADLARRYERMDADKQERIRQYRDESGE